MIHMKLSIAVITMNRSKQLVEAIRSCVACELPSDTQFIIIDNGSTDDTEIATKREFDSLSYKYYYKKMPDNVGAGMGRNIAFTYCEAEYIYFMDDDAYIDTQLNKDFFKTCISLLDNHPHVATLTTQIYDLMWKANRLPDDRPVLEDELRKCYMVCGGSHFLRRSVYLHQQPYFPNNYGFEEMKASLIASDLGYHNAFTDKVRVIHNPLINKWDFQKKDNSKIIVGEIACQKAIKSAVYPKIVFPLVWLACKLRCHKHLNNEQVECVEKMSKDLLENYDFGNRISLRTVVRMYKDFGFLIF